MKALTIKQPWAQAIVLGLKRVENRTWRPPDSLMGERILIHAGLTLDPKGTDFCCARGLPKTDWQRGYIIGSARLVGVIASREDGLSAHTLPSPFYMRRAMFAFGDEWYDGPVGWVLDDPKLHEVPTPCKGAQGLWTAPEL